MRPQIRPALRIKKFQQPIFARRQFKQSPAAMRLSCDRIQRQISDAQHDGFGSPPRRPRERTRAIIRTARTVWADNHPPGVKAFHAFIHLAARGKQQHRRVVSLVAQLTQDAQAVATGQHDVEYEWHRRAVFVAINTLRRRRERRPRQSSRLQRLAK